MKLLLAIGALAILIVWDHTQNSGELTRWVIGWIIGLVRSSGV
ncbi:hypothetical protein [Oricola cellulosilytica]|nr:hypothetical protein [Oricola cellulosilytica]